MAGRLLSWPNGVGVASHTIVSGAISAGAGEAASSISGLPQAKAAIKSPWVFQITVPPMQGQKARRFGGFVSGFHAGVNVFSFPWSAIGDQINPLDIGLSAPQESNWNNGEPWNNGKGWTGGYPTETVTADQSKDYSIVSLGSTAWGDHLGVGDWFGFLGHYAVYRVTGVEAQVGQYRVWPPLRKAITTADVATLEPTIIFQSIGSPQEVLLPGRREAMTLQVNEVPDDVARVHYTLP